MSAKIIKHVVFGKKVEFFSHDEAQEFLGQLLRKFVVEFSEEFPVGVIEKFSKLFESFPVKLREEVPQKFSAEFERVFPVQQLQRIPQTVEICGSFPMVIRDGSRVGISVGNCRKNGRYFRCYSYS